MNDRVDREMLFAHFGMESILMPRFAILCHDHPFLHWDVLLEAGESCRTWRLLDSPARDVTTWPAEQIADHRLVYLDYEGPVSGNRGVVSQWDNGNFDWMICSADRCEVILSGEKWRGTFRFVRTDQAAWTCERAVD